ncbi:MAG: hypothetical protein U1F58_08480 [Burkholderiales bacterium]
MRHFFVSVGRGLLSSDLGSESSAGVSFDSARFIRRYPFARLPPAHRPRPRRGFDREDLVRGYASYSAGANKGQGGIINVIPNPAIASQSREFAMKYFAKNLDGK